MQYPRGRRREDGHPRPETLLCLLHGNAADSLNDIWGKGERLKSTMGRNARGLARRGPAGSLPSHLQKVKEERELAASKRGCET